MRIRLFRVAHDALASNPSIAACTMELFCKSSGTRKPQIISPDHRQFVHRVRDGIILASLEHPQIPRLLQVLTKIMTQLQSPLPDDQTAQHALGRTTRKVDGAKLPS